MEITTKNILKTLPFEESFRNDLLSRIDTMDADEKYRVEQIIWDAYYGLYVAKLNVNTANAMERAEKNNEPLDSDFYFRIREQTEKEMEDDLKKEVQKADLSAARTAMEKIIHEMKSAKKN